MQRGRLFAVQAQGKKKKKKQRRFSVYIAPWLDLSIPPLPRLLRPVAQVVLQRLVRIRQTRGQQQHRHQREHKPALDGLDRDPVGLILAHAIKEDHATVGMMGAGRRGVGGRAGSMGIAVHSVVIVERGGEGEMRRMHTKIVVCWSISVAIQYDMVQDPPRGSQRRSKGGRWIRSGFAEEEEEEAMIVV